MIVKIRRFGQVGRGLLAGAVLVTAVGCQSMPMAFRGSRDSAERGSDYAVASEESRETIGGKLSRWTLKWRKSSRPERSPEDVFDRSLAVEEGRTIVPVSREPIVSQPRAPRARLGSPLSKRVSRAVVDDPLPAIAMVEEDDRAIPSLPERMVEGEEESNWGSERLDQILLASAVGGDLEDLAVAPPEVPIGIEGEDPYRFAGMQEESLPSAEAEVLVEDGSVPIMPDFVSDGVLMDPLACGVGPDGRGLWDNVSSRFGASYYDTGIGNRWGGFTTLESTMQLCRQGNWFMHAALAGEVTDNEYPMSFSAGFSRLAKIVGTQVEKPWIFAVAYDGFWTSDFFQTNQALYTDQLRGMIGYALKPCWDVGVWGAGGLSTKRMTLPGFGTPPFDYRVSAGDRVAGYSAMHLCQTGIFTIVSAGWENGPGGFFVESDGYIPLTAGCNFFIGGGYSDSFQGSTDLQLGFEFIWGRTCLARCLAKKHGVSAPTVGKMTADMLPKHSACQVCIDPTCVRYRGGWANDTYRSAFRINPPSRFFRMLDYRAVSTTIPGTNGGQTTAPPPPGGAGENPPVEEDCPPNANPLEQTIPRIENRPQRESRLSQWLEKNGGSSHGKSSI